MLIDADKLLECFCNDCGVKYGEEEQDDCQTECIVAKTISNMPCVHPNCSNCKRYNVENGVCVNSDSEWISDYREDDNNGTLKELSSQVPPKAKWIYHDTHYQCSNCGAITASGIANYCFRCGAKMEEEI